MNICVKLKQRQNGKYRKVVSIDGCLYDTECLQISSSTPYSAGVALEDGEWFSVQNASSQDYANDLIKNQYETVDFDELKQTEFQNTDYLFIMEGNKVIFQNVSKSKLIAKKSIFALGEGFKYTDCRREITINEIPDAIYIRDIDTLYFKRLESITSIFHGIDQLYREATTEETTQFLDLGFVNLQNGFSASQVKTANRKRIALAKKTIDALDETSRKNIFSYIKDYCPTLMKTDDVFDVGSEEDLKLLLYGIEQRFYTTVVGNEKRIANSVVPLPAQQNN